ncbi:unnamed protein product [Paramecium sonneborni]|uniref:Uncharacterized protein n=1 Tax=Paramecium sonneborni TaxID=65129 RepID=A0A8S1LYC5_9CILI|nr:unnamed protein product [Paramecium sonneborni]
MQRSIPAQSQPVLSRKSKISELEENLFSKLDNLFVDQPKQEQIQTQQLKVDLLEQAKQRIQQKKEVNPSFFEEGRKKLAAQRKKDTFLITAVNSIPQKQYKKQSQTQEYYKEETDCNNMLRDLIAQEERPYDDLAELRKMIAQTEQCMVEYVDDMHKLNKNVVKYNNEARKIGMGVDDKLFDFVDHKCNKYLTKSKTTTVIKDKKY